MIEKLPLVDVTIEDVQNFDQQYDTYVDQDMASMNVEKKSFWADKLQRIKTNKTVERFFGSETAGVGPGQLLARLAMFGLISTPLMWGLDSYADSTRDCYPNCTPDQEEIYLAQQEYLDSLSQANITASQNSEFDTQQGGLENTNNAKAVIFPSFTEVGFYGDSRAWYMAEGARLVPGWTVENHARQGCAFLTQERIYTRYNEDIAPRERSSSEQSSGEVVVCDVGSYDMPDRKSDLAIVYAGTLLAADVGLDSESLNSPLDEEWADYLVQNIITSIESIPARKVVLLSTPFSANVRGERSDDLEGWFWADYERLDAVDSILERVANELGSRVIMLSGFDEWVESQQNEECEPDGSHFTLDCARDASVWVNDQLELK